MCRDYDYSSALYNPNVVDLIEKNYRLKRREKPYFLYMKNITNLLR